MEQVVHHCLKGEGGGRPNVAKQRECALYLLSSLSLGLLFPSRCDLKAVHLSFDRR